MYGNVVRANAKFNWAHQLTVVDSGPEHVRMRYVDLAGVGYHRYDCEYTKGLLATVPQLFGLPLAQVAQPVCGAHGGECCEFDVRWSAGTHRLKRLAAGLAAGAGATAAVGALAEPPSRCRTRAWSSGWNGRRRRTRSRGSPTSACSAATARPCSAPPRAAAMRFRS